MILETFIVSTMEIETREECKKKVVTNETDLIGNEYLNE